jgi:hypothetical protein
MTPDQAADDLPLEYINEVKDLLRKLDGKYARSIFGESGVDLAHVSGDEPYLYWGSGVNRAVSQGILGVVLDKARNVAPSALKPNMAQLIAGYNHAVISAAAAEHGRLGRLLDELDGKSSAVELALIARRIRDATSEIRQRLDSVRDFKVLPLQTERSDGPSPEERRERLVGYCYRVIVAADQVIRLSRILSPDNDDWGDEDSDDTEPADPSLQILREQYAHRGLSQSKVLMARQTRRLLRDLRTLPLERPG